MWLAELCGDPQTSKQFSDRVLAQLAEGSDTEKKKRIKDILFGNPLEISVNFKNIDLLPSVVTHTFDPSSEGRGRQISEFEASLI